MKLLLRRTLRLLKRCAASAKFMSSAFLTFYNSPETFMRSEQNPQQINQSKHLQPNPCHQPKPVQP